MREVEEGFPTKIEAFPRKIRGQLEPLFFLEVGRTEVGARETTFNVSLSSLSPSGPWICARIKGNQGQEDVFAFIAFRLAVIGDATRTSLGFTSILGGAARSTNREIPDSHLLDS